MNIVLHNSNILLDGSGSLNLDPSCCPGCLPPGCYKAPCPVPSNHVYTGSGCTPELAAITFPTRINYVLTFSGINQCDGCYELDPFGNYFKIVSLNIPSVQTSGSSPITGSSLIYNKYTDECITITDDSPITFNLNVSFSTCYSVPGPAIQIGCGIQSPSGGYGMCFEGTAIGQWNYSADATSGHFSVPITNTQTCGGYDTLGGWAAAFGGSMTLSYVAG